jgi:hypothetical protein
VRDHVHGWLDLVFEPIGQLMLKNIERPVEAFVLRLDQAAQARALDGCTWDRIAQVSGHWLAKPRILHPWPDVRFAVTHTEVGAECPNRARWDLRGGRPATGVPTAISLARQTLPRAPRPIDRAGTT